MATRLFLTQVDAEMLDEHQLLGLLYTSILVIEDRWAELGRVQRRQVCAEARIIIRELQRRGSQLRMY